MGHAVYMGAYKNENMLVEKLQKKTQLGDLGIYFRRKTKKIK